MMQGKGGRNITRQFFSLSPVSSFQYHPSVILSITQSVMFTITQSVTRVFLGKKLVYKKHEAKIRQKLRDI